jgi:anti-anti-sigma factor
MPVDGFHAGAIIDGDWAVLVLEGELDYGFQQRARDALARIEHTRTLVVDLRAVTFVDSSGVHLLFEARAHCRRLVVVRGPAPVHRTLAALELEGEFEFVDEPLLAA